MGKWSFTATLSICQYPHTAKKFNFILQPCLKIVSSMVRAILQQIAKKVV